MEQYTVAGDAFERGFSEEALDYVNRAIDGYGEKSGFKLESRFYILRGLIRLGGSKKLSTIIKMKRFIYID